MTGPHNVPGVERTMLGVFPRKQPMQRAHTPLPYKSAHPPTQIGIVVAPAYLASIDDAARGAGLSRAAWMRHALHRELAGDHDGVEPKTWPPARGRAGRLPVSTTVGKGDLARLSLGAKLRGLTRASLLRYAMDRELAGATAL